MGDVKGNEKKRNIEKIDIIIFTIIIAIFGIGLLSFFPGILTSDCVDQINQALTNNYYISHPIIHSFIIGNLTKLGGIWVPALFQIIVFAIIWTYICKSLRKYNKSKINRIMQVVITIIICCIPLNFMYSITLWKDILYSYSILLLLPLVYIGIKEKYNYSLMQIILISLSCVGIMKFRKNGVPIGFIMFSILFILNAFKIKSIKTSGKFIFSFILILFVMTLPEKCVHQIETAKGGGVLNSTKVYCFGALLNQNIQLEDDEKEFLSKILDLQEWKESYDPYNGTPILFSNNIDHTVLAKKENEEKFNKIFMKYANQNKKVVISHFKSINSIWWSIEELGGMHSVVLSNNWISEMSGGVYDNQPILQNGNERLIDYTNKTFSDKISYEIMYRPAFALYLSIILLVCICIKQRKEGWLGYCLLLFPMIMNIGTYVILISSQDQRYFYPNFMTEYFMILLFVSIFCNKSKKKKVIKDNEVLNKKLLIMQNSSGDIKEIVERVNSQQIENLDILIITDEQNINNIELKNTTYINIEDKLNPDASKQLGYVYADKFGYDLAIEIDNIEDTNYIEKMIEKVKQGNDLVIGRKKDSKKEIISGAIKYISDKNIDSISNFRAANKSIIYEFSKNYYDNNYFVPCSNMDILMKDYKVDELLVKSKGKIEKQKFKDRIKEIKIALLLLIRGVNY